MADQPPFCIHCGAQQLASDSQFCHRCGQPVVPARPNRVKATPWLAPALVSAAIVIVAAFALARVQLARPAASEPTAAMPVRPATEVAATAIGTVQAPTTQTAPTAAVVMVMLKTPTPSPLPASTGTPPPAPTAANVTPEPVKLTRLAWSPDGALLAIGSGTGVYLYDTRTWQERRFIPLTDAATSVAFGFDGRLLGTASQGSGSKHPLEVWRVADGSLAYTLAAYGTLLTASPTAGLWAGFDPSNGVKLWRAEDGQTVRTIAIATGERPSAIAFSPNGQMLAIGSVGSPEGELNVWRVSDGGFISRAQRSRDLFIMGWLNLAFHPDGVTLAAVGTDDILELWDVRSGARIRHLTGANDLTKEPVVTKVRFAPDGNLFATSHTAGPNIEGGSIQLWKADGTRDRSWPVVAAPGDIAFSPDGKLLLATVGQSLLMFDPVDGGVVRQAEPVWHQGILPTPTPTPFHVNVDLPSDWKEYLYLGEGMNNFKLRIPPTWEGSESGVFRVPSSSDNPRNAMVVTVHRHSCAFRGNNPGGQASVEEIKQFYSLDLPGFKRVFITGGQWPLLIPATYAVFDTTWNSGEQTTPGAPADRKTRETFLLWRPQADGMCMEATLEDDLGDISEQNRLDLSRVLASTEFEDRQHPFPTATPKPTPTPNSAPRPELPLQILAHGELSRLAGGGVAAVISIELKDALGNPARGAEVKIVMSGREWDFGLDYDGEGHYLGSFSPVSDANQTMRVKVYWKKELIGEQDFAVSWQ